ncbi:K(+)-transporting ATPase subunit C [Macrococcoides canis]|uniref:Potassium-transporting ATPase KdpC subunit n=1 Tax=Macrococcoides canis TaxID=1855823 RepID=A0A6G7EUV5_9STAP|nr:K(+)-transporting ATPase subunit C [Macrococcus canis]MCO4095991.1 K(+)-transporting ATPase subunit C [Macrococcus canis]QCT73862.1 K(+)-transporting ATPase subunit C [Macrococcus canis]QIH77280.1 K(+)-transporting ATPase subunit C [Macrococcus canis]QNR06891.1 K(+)-transporting ATPase subunit C [Macrococcus canis]QUR94449.1 K(+)-transporting ATPase subunit C [Macrococcus canis]
MLRTLKSSLFTSILLMIVCGLIYPLVVTGIANFIFPFQSEGSLMKSDNTIIGSKHIGQTFTSKKYLHSRISAVNYNVDATREKTLTPVSGGSNMSNKNPELEKRINTSIQELQKEYNGKAPVDLITASGSGLDPNITLDAAKYQLDRIVRYSKLEKEEVIKIFNKHTYKNSDYTFVNVLEVNQDIYEKTKNS